MRWFNIIEAPFAFFFLGSKGRSKLEIHRRFDPTKREWFPEKENFEAAYAAKFHYEIQIRKKFGLGFLLSFIPATAAFKARINYLKYLLACDEESLAELQANKSAEFLDNLWEFPAYLWIISQITSPLYFGAKFFKAWAWILNQVRHDILTNKENLSRAELLFRGKAFLPPETILNTNPSWLRRIGLFLHYCTNPFSFISLALIVLHYWTDQVLEMGILEGSWLSISLKTVSAAVFIPLKLGFGTLSAIVDSFWECLGFLTLEPAKFIFASIKQTIQHWNEDWNPEMIVTDSRTLQAVKVLRKFDKAMREDVLQTKLEGPNAGTNVNELANLSYSQICNRMTKAENHATKYLTLTKYQAYQIQPLNEENTIVVLEVASEKATEFNHYKQSIKNNKEILLNPIRRISQLHFSPGDNRVGYFFRDECNLGLANRESIKSTTSRV